MGKIIVIDFFTLATLTIVKEDTSEYWFKTIDDKHGSMHFWKLKFIW